MSIPNIKKPNDPRFSCGPTKKPEGWSLKKIKDKFLGRYHRSDDVKIYIDKQISKLRKTLQIPNDYRIYIIPGSCTGAMEAVIWSVLGNRKITAIVYDHWGKTWCDDINKLHFKLDSRVSLDGSMPELKQIPKDNDLLFVWTGTTTGISINNLEFLNVNHNGLVVSDINSAVFIYDIPWKKIDVSVFSWQKALGSESQHGIIVMSPKAIDDLRQKNNIPKIFDLKKINFLINTPSLLSIADFELCLDIYNKNGGLMGNKKKCETNYSVISNWIKTNGYLNQFAQKEKFRALSPVYATFEHKFNYDDLFKFLNKNQIAYDIKNYRLCEPGIRIWTGPTIKKNDLIALTNWLDWSFNKFV